MDAIVKPKRELVMTNKAISNRRSYQKQKNADPAFMELKRKKRLIYYYKMKELKKNGLACNIDEKLKNEK
jgi:hypothetical protein